MASTILHIADLLLWFILAASTLYVFIFALFSLLPRRKEKEEDGSPAINTFIVIFPAYKEDKVIIPSVETFLRQDYPRDLYHVAVVSDQMEDATNERLSTLPITFLKPSFDKSSKAKALQYAISTIHSQYNYVVILDADNHVKPDFLRQLNHQCSQGYKAIQCHRTAKNANNDIAVLDGISEEINNSLFRRGHNRIGLSSALIGSGMCFDYEWFSQNVGLLDSAVEDRELEALLMKQRIHIHYAETIHVKDEKVSSQDNFQRQRLRWMTGQVQALVSMLPYLPKAIISGNLNYIDKTIQQALVPRSILLVVLTFMSILTTIVAILSPLTSYLLPLKWWLLLALLCLSLLIAIPAQLRTCTVFGKILLVPQLVWRMVKNVGHISTKNKEFIHTTHDK